MVECQKQLLTDGGARRSRNIIIGKAEDCVRTMNGRFWLMVERTQEEMAQLLPEPIQETVPAVGVTETVAVDVADGNTAGHDERDADTAAEPRLW